MNQLAPLTPALPALADDLGAARDFADGDRSIDADGLRVGHPRLRDLGPPARSSTRCLPRPRPFAPSWRRRPAPAAGATVWKMQAVTRHKSLDVLSGYVR